MSTPNGLVRLFIFSACLVTEISVPPNTYADAQLETPDTSAWLMLKQWLSVGINQTLITCYWGHHPDVIWIHAMGWGPLSSFHFVPAGVRHIICDSTLSKNSPLKNSHINFKELQDYKLKSKHTKQACYCSQPQPLATKTNCKNKMDLKPTRRKSTASFQI